MPEILNLTLGVKIIAKQSPRPRAEVPMHVLVHNRMVHRIVTKDAQYFWLPVKVVPPRVNMFFNSPGLPALKHSDS